MANVGKRAARANAFIGKESWVASAISGDLIVAANSLLALALHDRRRVVYRLAGTHYTEHAFGAITLIVTALEAFLNQAYDFSADHLPWARTFAATAGLLAKYEGLFHAATPPGSIAETRELETLVDVRHEIMHYLPRPAPPLIDHLERRGLLMSTPMARGWDMGQKLPSYALVYWAFETVEASVKQLVDVTPEQRWLSMALAPNFALFRSVACHPSLLPDFDRDFDLDLTENTRSRKL
jgi:hypothetical protein